MNEISIDDRLKTIEHENQLLRNRLDAVQRRGRWLAAAGILLLVLIAAGAGTAALESDQFVLRYQKTGMMFLGYSSDQKGGGATGLAFFDRDGRRRIYIGFSDTGVPNVTLYNADGNMAKQLIP